MAQSPPTITQVGGGGGGCKLCSHTTLWINMNSESFPEHTWLVRFFKKLVVSVIHNTTTTCIGGYPTNFGQQVQYPIQMEALQTFL